MSVSRQVALAFVMDAGVGSNTVLVAKTCGSVTAFASAADQVLIRGMFLLKPHPDQVDDPMNATNNLREMAGYSSVAKTAATLGACFILRIPDWGRWPAD